MRYEVVQPFDHDATGHQSLGNVFDLPDAALAASLVKSGHLKATRAAANVVLPTPRTGAAAADAAAVSTPTSAKPARAKPGPKPGAKRVAKAASKAKAKPARAAKAAPAAPSAGE